MQIQLVCPPQSRFSDCSDTSETVLRTGAARAVCFKSCRCIVQLKLAANIQLAQKKKRSKKLDSAYEQAHNYAQNMWVNIQYSHVSADSARKHNTKKTDPLLIAPCLNMWLVCVSAAALWSRACALRPSCLQQVLVLQTSSARTCSLGNLKSSFDYRGILKMSLTVPQVDPRFGKLLVNTVD